MTDAPETICLMPNDMHVDVWSNPIVSDPYEDGDECVEYIRADRVRVTGFEDAPQWQTIDSAPGGGRRFLAYRPGRGVSEACIPPKCACGDWYKIEGKWCGVADSMDATHWMARPKPPT
jgi:hypothetical protein